MTFERRREIIAVMSSAEILGSLFAPLLMALSEPWTHWNFLLLGCAGVLAPILFVKFLPYARWFAGKFLEYYGKRDCR